MVRIIGREIPDKKPICIALTYLYGIGAPRALEALRQAEVDPRKRAKELSAQELERIKRALAQYKLEGDLKQEIRSHIKRLIEISSYRGSRHERHLPVRGQRTRTNSRTVRGNVRKTVGSGRRKAPAPK